ncbi:tripartite motif containing 4 [Rhinolophus ferrumequinum]|uniref:Polyadenylate-binding protein-interacting protein 1 n=1 Tax=Rhinolophus ferrumequinum TaxID=59479 RepID=A0A7J7Y6T6_RHIFE|nr:E3 ubiquitin-protein ligase TRIM4 isoform X1 [Rhinolophus ferrumequinum]KAF6357693.1 tripartite motif containing 4 [Rhinolophus ferrumequinum]
MPLGQDAASSGSDTATPVLARCGPATPAGRPARAGIESRKVRFNFPKPREAPAAVPRAAGLQGPPAAHRPLRRVAAHPTRALGKSSVMEAKDLQEELTCSICLDYFKDPVSIECGHNFCRCCLQRSWEPGGGQFPCPECRQLSSPAALRPNWVLARLTRTVRPGRQGPVPPGLCGRHWEPLRLFCEEDQRPVCLVCRESQEHQTHTMAPIDEAFENYREKLLKTQCDLKAKMKEAMRLHDMEVKSVTDWQNKMKNKRLSLSAEYAKLHRFLAEEEQLFLQRLSKEEEETKKKWNENSLRLNQIITSLKELILEVWEKSQCSSLELLQNPKDLLTRSENQDVNYSLEDLKVTSVCHIPMMKEMLKQVQEQPGSFETEIEQFAETLNGWVTTDDALQELVELIYQQATSIPNFSYMGARLCNYLSHHLTISPQSGRFRQLLLQRCRTEYEAKDQAAKGDEVTRKRFHAFVLFLGELYLNLEIKGTNGQVTRADILQVGLRELLNALLSNPMDDNLICAVKLLKLTGSVLEDAWKEKGKTDMVEIIQRIENVVLGANCSRDVKQMLLKLVELRSSNWGRVHVTSTYREATPENDPNYFMNEPTFYTSDGVSLHCS